MTDLKSKIQDWEFKYAHDVEQLQTEYNRLLNFTDVERSVNAYAIAGIKKSWKFAEEQLKAVKNILRTPRLTEQYQRQMARQIKQYD